MKVLLKLLTLKGEIDAYWIDGKYPPYAIDLAFMNKLFVRFSDIDIPENKYHCHRIHFELQEWRGTGVPEYECIEID